MQGRQRNERVNESNTEGSTLFKRLPSDVLGLIFQRLSVIDANNVCATAKSMRQLIGGIQVQVSHTSKRLSFWQARTSAETRDAFLQTSLKQLAPAPDSAVYQALMTPDMSLNILLLGNSELRHHCMKNDDSINQIGVAIETIKVNERLVRLNAVSTGPKNLYSTAMLRNAHAVVLFVNNEEELRLLLEKFTNLEDLKNKMVIIAHPPLIKINHIRLNVHCRIELTEENCNQFAAKITSKMERVASLIEKAHPTVMTDVFNIEAPQTSERHSTCSIS